MPIGVECR